MVERLTLCNSDFSDLSYLCALAAVQACHNSNIGSTHYFARRVPGYWPAWTCSLIHLQGNRNQSYLTQTSVHDHERFRTPFFDTCSIFVDISRSQQKSVSKSPSQSRAPLNASLQPQLSAHQHTLHILIFRNTTTSTSTSTTTRPPPPTAPPTNPPHHAITTSKKYHYVLRLRLQPLAAPNVHPLPNRDLPRHRAPKQLRLAHKHPRLRKRRRSPELPFPFSLPLPITTHTPTPYTASSTPSPRPTNRASTKTKACHHPTRKDTSRSTSGRRKRAG
jgi:hypothetical protein